MTAPVLSVSTTPPDAGAAASVKGATPMPESAFDFLALLTELTAAETTSQPTPAASLPLPETNSGESDPSTPQGQASVPSAAGTNNNTPTEIANATGAPIGVAAALARQLAQAAFEQAAPRTAAQTSILPASGAAAPN